MLSQQQQQGLEVVTMAHTGVVEALLPQTRQHHRMVKPGTSRPSNNRARRRQPYRPWLL
jgi:hypothetical protein